jgi:hypothetical protein
MVPLRRTGKRMFAIACFVLMLVPVFLPASGDLKRVAVTEQKDVWYVEQILGFSSKGTVLAARARVKFVAGDESFIGQNVKKELLMDVVNAEMFHYFVEAVEVDCKKNIFAVSKIDFFDSEDSKIFGQVFAEPKRYPSTPGSAFEIISWDLCQNEPGFIKTLKDTLKSKKSFLYFYPQ